MTANKGIPQNSSPIRQKLSQLKQICEKYDEGDGSISYHDEYSNILAEAYTQNIDQDTDLTENFGYINTTLGNMCYEEKNYDQALIHYNAAATYFNKTNNKTALAVSIQGISDSHYMLEQYAKVLEYNPIVINYYKDVEEISKAADAAYYSAEACLKLDKFKKAISFANQSLGFYESINDVANQAFVYNQLGRIQFCNNKFKSAVSYYKMAIELRQSLGLVEYLTRDYLDIGDAFYYADKNSKAKSAYLEAHANNKKSYDNDQQKLIYKSLANVCYFLDENEEAISYAMKAVELYTSEENQHDLIEIYSIIGNSYYYLDNYAQAIKAYSEAEWRCSLYFQNQNDMTKKASLNEDMYQCCYDMQQFETGINFLQQAIEINEEYENDLELANNYYEMANTLFRGLKEVEATFSYCKKAQELLSEFNEDAYLLKGKIWELLGDLAPKLLLTANKGFLNKYKEFSSLSTGILKSKMKNQTLDYYYEAKRCYKMADDKNSEDIILKKIKVVEEEL